MMLLLSPFRRTFAVVSLALCSSAAWAASDNAVIAFSSLGITGSFVVKIDRTTQALTQLTSVSLNVHGHEYKKKDIEFTYDSAADLNLIGGAITGPENVAIGAGPDFYLIWRPKDATGYFTYTDKNATTAPFDVAVIVLSVRKYQ